MDKYDNFIFDCDGVLWYLDHPIDGSIETLNTLVEKGKKVFFVTNNSAKSRSALVDKLCRLGFSADSSQAYSASTVAPLFLREHYPETKKVFLIGMSEFREVLEGGGFEVLHISDFSERIENLEDMRKVRIDESIGCVMVGFDYSFTYAAGMYGSMCIQNGAAFLASNKDSYSATPWGKFPAGGTMVTFLETATDQQAVVFGKPEPFLFQVIEKEHSIDKSRTLMVGDRFDTDIMFGINSGIDSLLVETGVHNRLDAEKYGIQPTHVLPALRDLFSL